MALQQEQHCNGVSLLKVRRDPCRASLLITAFLVAPMINGSLVQADSDGIDAVDIAVNPRTLLLKCVDFQSKMRRCMVKISNREEHGRFRDDPRPSRDIAFLIRRDGLRLDLSGRFLYPTPWEQDSSELRIVANDKYYITYEFRFNQFDHAKGGVASEHPRDRAPDILPGLPYGGALDGYCTGTGEQTLAEVLLADPISLTVGDQTTQGMHCHSISGRTQVGEIELVLDRQGRMRAFTYNKGPNDPYQNNKPLADRKDRFVLDEAEQIAGDLYLRGWSAQLHDANYGPADDAPAPLSGRLIVTRTLSDGHEMLTTYNYHREILSIDPAFGGSNAFVVDGLPEGARLTNMDNPTSGVMYVWKQGAMVTALTDFSVPAPGSGFNPVSSRSRFWLLVVNILIVAGGLIYWLSRRQRN